VFEPAEEAYVFASSLGQTTGKTHALIKSLYGCHWPQTAEQHWRHSLK